MEEKNKKQPRKLVWKSNESDQVISSKTDSRNGHRMVMHGVGLLRYSETKYYKGMFKNGMKDGSGLLVDGKVKYKGNFTLNMKNGYGILY